MLKVHVKNRHFFSARSHIHVIFNYFGIMWKMCLYIMLAEGCWLLGLVFSVKIEEAFAGWWDLGAFCPATEKEGILCLLPLWILHLFVHYCNCLAFLSSWMHNVFRSFFRLIYGFPVITRGFKCQDLLFYKTNNKTTPKFPSRIQSFPIPVPMVLPVIKLVLKVLEP